MIKKYKDTLHKVTYSCDNCSFEDEQIEVLRAHKEENHHIYCDLCEIKFETKSLFDYHVKLKHQCIYCKLQIKDKMCKCVDCDQNCCYQCRDKRLKKYMGQAEMKFSIHFKEYQVLCIKCLKSRIEQYGTKK